MRHLVHLVTLALLLGALSPPAEAATYRELRCLGDSITEGIAGQSGPWCPLLAERRSGTNFAALNEGLGGDTSTGLLVRWAADIRPYVGSPLRTKVLILIGTNDLASGVAAATIYANIRTLALQAQEDGMEVVLLTVLPRSLAASYSGDLQARLDALNALILAAPTNPDLALRIPGALVVDTYTAMGEPGTPVQLRTTYTSGDGLHLNSVGNAALANAVDDALVLASRLLPFPRRQHAVTPRHLLKRAS
jgi:lysophospholipase L1-like esterase